MKPSLKEAIDAFRKEWQEAKKRKEARDEKTWKDLKDFAESDTWKEFQEKGED